MFGNYNFKNSSVQEKPKLQNNIINTNKEESKSNDSFLKINN